MAVVTDPVVTRRYLIRALSLPLVTRRYLIVTPSLPWPQLKQLQTAIHSWASQTMSHLSMPSVMISGAALPIPLPVQATKVSNAATMPPMPPMPPCRHNAANNAATMPPMPPIMPPECRLCRQTMPPCRHAANNAAGGIVCRHNAAWRHCMPPTMPPMPPIMPPMPPTMPPTMPPAMPP